MIEAINGNMLAYTPGALAGFIRNNLLNESEKGFLKYFEGSEEQLTDFVTPPYFYLKETTYKEWLKLNIDFINIAKD